MKLEPWERAFLAALERGPMTASMGLIEAGRDWAHPNGVTCNHKMPVGPTRNGWDRRTDKRVGSKKLRKGNGNAEGNRRREGDPRG